jgi:flagellar basal body-associated protein FliL
MKRTIVMFVLILVTSAITAAAAPLRSLKKNIRAPVQSPPSNRLISSAPAASSSTAQQSGQKENTGRAIVVLQTRDNLITIYSGEKDLLYSVSTESGISLADQLTASELKVRFPELYEIATGIAWAGM